MYDVRWYTRKYCAAFFCYLYWSVYLIYWNHNSIDVHIRFVYEKIKIQARESNILEDVAFFSTYFFLIISKVYYLSQNATFTYMKFIFVCYIVFMHCYNKTQCIINHVICKTQKKIKLKWMMLDNTFILEILSYIILRMENVLSFTVFDKLRTIALSSTPIKIYPSTQHS